HVTGVQTCALPICRSYRAQPRVPSCDRPDTGDISPSAGPGHPGVAVVTVVVTPSRALPQGAPEGPMVALSATMGPSGVHSRRSLVTLSEYSGAQSESRLRQLKHLG